MSLIKGFQHPVILFKTSTYVFAFIRKCIYVYLGKDVKQYR